MFNIAQKAKNTIMFRDNDHKKYFLDRYEGISINHSSVSAMFYCLGIHPETRDHEHEIFNFQSREIIPECLEKKWQNAETRSTCLLAFNLFSGSMPSIDFNATDRAELEWDSISYTPDQIFKSGYGIYHIEALKIRFPWLMDKPNGTVIATIKTEPIKEKIYGTVF